MNDQISQLRRILVPERSGMANFRSRSCSDWRSPPMQMTDTVRLRMDDAAWRIAIHPGDANRLEYAGWDAGSEAELAGAVTDADQCRRDR